MVLQAKVQGSIQVLTTVYKVQVQMAARARCPFEWHAPCPAMRTHKNEFVPGCGLSPCAQNPGKDKDISAENFLKVLTMVEYGRWHGEAVEL